MNSNPLLACLALSAISLSLGFGCNSKSAHGPTDPEVESLISDLSKMAEPTAGVHPSASFAAFMAIDEQPEFQGGILGVPPPPVNPAMRRLVQMGVRALPSLIEHLSDNRETGLTEDHGYGFGAYMVRQRIQP